MASAFSVSLYKLQMQHLKDLVVSRQQSSVANHEELFGESFIMCFFCEWPYCIPAKSLYNITYILVFITCQVFIDMISQDWKL